MRRGILGGTFDPPHLAHLVAGEAAYRQLDLEEVTFLPAGAPWQKAGRGVTAAEHRWEMTRLAVEGIDYFRPDDLEVRRDGPTYTIDTVEELPASDDLVLVLGADSAARLPTWHRWEELLERVELAVAPRPGTEREAVDRVVGGRAIWLDMPALPISGTALRERSEAGRSIRFLVPEAVCAYIAEQGLYGRT